MPLEHDEMCHEQTTSLVLLKSQMHTHDDTLQEIVRRVQQLVNEYHAQNVIQARMEGDITHIRAKVDEIEKNLEKDYALRSEFVEVKSEWRKFLGIILIGVALAFIGFVLKGGLK